MFMTENLQAAILALPLELERIGAQIAAGLAESHAGQRIDAARYVTVKPGALWGGKCRLAGWSLRSTGEGPAAVTLRNGRDDSDDAVAVITLATTGAAQTIWLDGGVTVTEALWASVTGAVEGVVYLAVVD